MRRRDASRSGGAGPVAGTLGALVYATGALALLATLGAGMVVAWALFGAGKTYVFALDGVVEWLEVDRVTQPAVTRIVLLNAAGGGRDHAVTGQVLPAERSRVAIERRGSSPVRISLSADTGVAGQLEWRTSDGEQAVDLEGDTGFRVPILETTGDGAACVKPSSTAQCLPPGTMRATLQGPLDLGEESAVAAVSARHLAAGPVPMQNIAVRMFGRSTLFSAGAIYELGQFSLPPDARLKPAQGEASLWATTVVPAKDGGLQVSATTTARELRVFTAAGPTEGDSIRASFFAVLFNDPDIAGLLSVALLSGGACQLLELLRVRVQARREAR